MVVVVAVAPTTTILHLIVFSFSFYFFFQLQISRPSVSRTLQQRILDPTGSNLITPSTSSIYFRNRAQEEELATFLLLERNTRTAEQSMRSFSLAV